jgi:crotonobetainyl-CoA:carnitine CoA-transferase CaiB-like acyl-CoA transferase
MWSAISVLAALSRRDRGWSGPQQIDTSLLDGQMALIPYFSAYYLNGGFLAGPQGSGGHSPTYGAYECADGRYIVIAVIDQKPWTALCQALGRTDLLDDPRYGSAALRIEHTAELTAELERHFAGHRSDEILAALAAYAVPSARVNNLAEALDEPQVRARDMVVQVPHLNGGSVGLTGSPIKLSDFRPPYTAPPTHGSDSARLREEFGLRWRPSPTTDPAPSTGRGDS